MTVAAEYPARSWAWRVVRFWKVSRASSADICGRETTGTRSGVDTSATASQGTLSPGTDGAASGVVIAAAGPKDWDAETPDNTDPKTKNMTARGLMRYMGYFFYTGFAAI